MKRRYEMRYEIKPILTNRKWILLGMAIGTALGAVPVLLPAPIGPILTWVCCGVFAGGALPIVKLFALVERGHQRLWWRLIGLGCLLGGLIGLGYGLSGEPAFEWAPAATCSCGFFAGYAVAEILIRRRDARILAKGVIRELL